MFNYTSIVDSYSSIISSTGLYFIDDKASNIEKEIFTIMILSSPFIALIEGNNLLNFAYSKFGIKDQKSAIPSKVGMFILYFVPLLSFMYVSWAVLLHISWYHTIISLLIIGHLSKRCLETLYIHKYSGFMSLPTVIAICCFYSMFSFTIGYYLTNRIKGIEDHGPVIESMEFVIGLFLYCIGICGNY